MIYPFLWDHLVPYCRHVTLPLGGLGHNGASMVVYVHCICVTQFSQIAHHRVLLEWFTVGPRAIPECTSLGYITQNVLGGKGAT